MKTEQDIITFAHSLVPDNLDGIERTATGVTLLRHNVTQFGISAFCAGRDSQLAEVDRLQRDAVIKDAEIGQLAGRLAATEARLDWLCHTEAFMVYSKDGDYCWLHWPYGREDEDDRPINQKGKFDSVNESIDAAMAASIAPGSEGVE